MTRRSTLFLTVGLPGTGKTTEARRIEAEEKALRLTKDEWGESPLRAREPTIGLGRNRRTAHRDWATRSRARHQLIIDFRLWGRDERSALRASAADLGAAVDMRYFELMPAEQRQRLDRRHAEEAHTTWHMSDEELATWAAIISIPTPGELDGSEPVDDPPAGFATWDEWRRHRWPPSIS